MVTRDHARCPDERHADCLKSAMYKPQVIGPSAGVDANTLSRLGGTHAHTADTGAAIFHGAAACPATCSSRRSSVTNWPGSASVVTDLALPETVSPDVLGHMTPCEAVPTSRPAVTSPRVPSRARRAAEVLRVCARSALQPDVPAGGIWASLTRSSKCRARFPARVQVFCAFRAGIRAGWPGGR
jgi:hypothetical protein